MKKKILTLLFFLFVFNISAQDYTSKIHIDKINKVYTSKLNLSKDISEKVKGILTVYNLKLYQLETSSNDSRLFNKIFKEYTLAIFELLTDDQFREFKKLQIEIEPYKKYKL